MAEVPRLVPKRLKQPEQIPKPESAAAKALYDPSEVRKALKIIHERTEVFEIRALNAHFKGERFTGTIFGYFDSVDCCLEQLRLIQSALGIYITLNPLNPALLARAKNRLKYAKKGDAATNDKDVEKRRWLLVDVDAERPGGISATDEEKEDAGSKAQLIMAFLRERHWPAPVMSDSGNGMHLLYPVDLPCDDGKLIERLLEALSNRFNGDGAKIDRTVHNPARIVRLYGTLAAKGDDVSDRPYRMSKILCTP